MRYQIWGDNTEREHGFQSYINGYIDDKKEAIRKFNKYKREYKSYHRIELHEINGSYVVTKVLMTYTRRKNKLPQHYQ